MLANLQDCPLQRSKPSHMSAPSELHLRPPQGSKHRNLAIHIAHTCTVFSIFSADESFNLKTICLIIVRSSISSMYVNLSYLSYPVRPEKKSLPPTYRRQI